MKPKFLLVLVTLATYTHSTIHTDTQAPRSTIQVKPIYHRIRHSTHRSRQGIQSSYSYKSTPPGLRLPWCPLNNRTIVIPLSMLKDPRQIVDIASTHTYVLKKTPQNTKCTEIVDTTIGKAECTLPHYCYPAHSIVIRDKYFGETAACIGYQTTLPDVNPLKHTNHPDRTNKWARLYDIIPDDEPTLKAGIIGQTNQFKVLLIDNMYHLYTAEQLRHKTWYNAEEKKIIAHNTIETPQYQEKIGYCRPTPGPEYNMEPIIVSPDIYHIFSNLPLLVEVCIDEQTRRPPRKFLYPITPTKCVNELGIYKDCEMITDFICNPIASTSQFYIQGYLYIKRLIMMTFEMIESVFIYLLKMVIEILLEILLEINDKIRLLESIIIYATSYYIIRDYVVAIYPSAAYVILFGLFRS